MYTSGIRIQSYKTCTVTVVTILLPLLANSSRLLLHHMTRKGKEFHAVWKWSPLYLASNELQLWLVYCISIHCPSCFVLSLVRSDTDGCLFAS